jgi:hypothetical protein
VNTEELLAWEARQRPKVAVAAVVAALLTVASSVWSALAFKDAPQAGLTQALERVTQPGAVAQSPSLRIPYFEFFSDHAADILATAVTRGLSLVGIGIVLTFLAVATRGRRSELPRFTPALAISGAVLSALATVLTAVATLQAVDAFLDGPRTVAAAEDLGRGSFLVTAQLIGLPGTLALAIAFVLVCLNAMRTGLLTRFLGILGIIVGVLLVFPIGSPIPVVQIFWLLAVGLLLLGKLRNPPPAWSSGEAAPWPSTIERRLGQQQPSLEPADSPRVSGPAGESPAAARKKRKKRR